MPKRAAIGAQVNLTVEVQNTGKTAGEEVVQLYLKAPGSSAIRSLEGFKRVALAAGQTKAVEFALTPRQLSAIQDNGKRVIKRGMVEITVGGKQPGFQGAADASTTGVIAGKVELTGSQKEID